MLLKSLPGISATKNTRQQQNGSSKGGGFLRVGCVDNQLVVHYWNVGVLSNLVCKSDADIIIIVEVGASTHVSYVDDIQLYTICY